MNESTNTRGWSDYYAATRGRPPRPTLRRALAGAASSAAPPGRRAIDLGCGTGRDTTLLLASGWHVVAVDQEATALAELRATTPDAWRARLVLREVAFAHWQPAPAELVNASFCLFFADRLAALRDLFERIAAALVPGGRFAGHLLGPRDSWVRTGRAIGLDRGELDVLFRGFCFEHLAEEEDDSLTPRGVAKHWHIWHINAVRRHSGQTLSRSSWRRS